MSLAKFKKLHTQASPLILGNVWDAYSAKLAETAGFQALGTSSHAIAFSLGYPDGEQIPFEELFFVVSRILKSVKIPVSVDFEAGYSKDPDQVAKYVKQLADIGVVGINLEDGIVKKGTRTLESASLLANKIEAIKKSTAIFINARTDTYTTKHTDALTESIKRAEQYKQAGADGIFVPLMESKSDISTFTTSIDLPLNLFLTPKLPKPDILSDLNVKRLSHGAKIYEWLMEKAAKELQSLLKNPKLPK